MTVNALAGGSPASTTVDLSATYLTWAERNLAANGFATGSEVWPPASGRPDASSATAAGPGAPASGPHTLVQADCLRWVAEAGGAYDLIWLDPPTFSNSKKMGRATFDVQRDHADLIRITARRLLAPGGILLFATNLRNFRLDRAELGGLHVRTSRARPSPSTANAEPTGTTCSRSSSAADRRGGAAPDRPHLTRSDESQFAAPLAKADT